MHYKKQNYCKAVLSMTCIMTILSVCLLTKEAAAQVEYEGPDPQQATTSYFEQRGLEEAREELSHFLDDVASDSRAMEKQQVSPNGVGERFANEFSANLSRQLALNGVTVADLQAMQQAGFKPAVGFLSSTISDDYAQQNTQAFALKHDLVVIGEVTAVEMTDEPDDGFTTTFQVRVDEQLRGQSSTNITVRQETGRTDGVQRARSHSGQIMEVLQDPNAVIGETFLLFLSSGTYEYERALYQTRRLDRDINRIAEEEPPEQIYALGEAHRMEGGELVRLHRERESLPYPSRAPESTAQMLEYIRGVDQVLKRDSQ
jgi:hypothetical protein